MKTLFMTQGKGWGLTRQPQQNPSIRPRFFHREALLDSYLPGRIKEEQAENGKISG